MPVTLTGDVDAFLAAVEPTLAADEAQYGLILGISLDYQRGDRTQPARFAIVRAEGDAGEIIGAAAYLPEREPIMMGTAEAGRALAETAHTAGWPLREVGGPVEGVDAFAQTWSALTGQSAHVAMAMRIFRLTRVIPLPTERHPAGVLRPADAHDIALIADWFGAFEVESTGQQDACAALATARQRVQAGQMWLWTVDGQSVAMAGATRPTAHGITVSAVYTPPAQRGRGYASACVAQLSQYLLDQGYAFCTLFTDLANPTSNHIYQQIGYTPVSDFTRYSFTSPATT